MSYPIYLDDRAGSKDLMEHLDPCLAELCRLDFGDALVIGNGPDDETLTIGVEVKSIHDLIQSANTGRLAGHQLPGMLTTYDVPWLLFYGDYRAGEGGTLQFSTGSKWRSLRIGSRLVPVGYLESFLFDVVALGVRVKQVHGERDAAVWLQCLHRWWSKRWSDHRGLRAFDRSREVSLLPGMDARTALTARVASQLPGIGFEKAVAVANHFASVKDMVNAHPNQWMQVPGIGKVIASAVVDAMEG